MKMASRLLRRSGVAVALITELIEWKPSVIFQVGVGTHHKEVDVFQEAWPDAELIGWEPHPEIYKQIRKEYPGILHQCALGEDVGEASLYFDPAHIEGASFFANVSDPVKNAQDRLQSIEVKIDSLDNFCRPIDIPQRRENPLLWLDCEGAELEVLKGGEKFIEGVDVINIEVTGKPPRYGWPSPVEVNRWLLDHGFVCQYIHTHRCTSGQNDVVYVKPDLFRPEYCSCPLQVEDWEKRNENGD
jgi:FkbM family methyltransferase